MCSSGQRRYGVRSKVVRERTRSKRVAGFSASRWKNPATPSPAASQKCGKAPVLIPIRDASLASFLRSEGTEHHVLRAAVLSIVLILAAGPNATLLCGIWCNSRTAATSGCLHEKQASSASVRAGDRCDHEVLSVAAFLREDVWRSVFVGADHAMPVPRYQLSSSTIDARPGHEPGREWALEERPLPTILRI